MVNMIKTDKEYKELSIKEFNKAAEKYESGNAGIYENVQEGLSSNSRRNKKNRI